MHSKCSPVADNPAFATMADDGIERTPAPTLRRNIISIYGAYVINGVLSVVVVPLALNRFGSDGYGLFAIYGVMTLCCSLLGMGLQKHFSRLLASERELTSQIANLRVALTLRLAISMAMVLSLPVLCVIVPWLLFPVDSHDISLVQWLVILAVFEYLLATPSDLMAIFSIANEHIDRYSAFVVITGLFRYALIFLGVLVFGSPLPTVGLLVMRRFVDPWVGYRIMGRYPSSAWRPQFASGALIASFRGSTILSFSEVGQVVMVSLGSVLANAYCGLSGLGFYRAAFDLTSRLYVISNGLALVIFPRFAKLMATQESVSPTMVRMGDILNASWAGYLVFCILGAWAAPFVLPWLGFQSGAVQLFILLLLGTGMNAHGVLSYQFLLAAGKYWRATFAVALGIGTLAATFAALHVHFGILALGWSWIISQFTYAIAVDTQARRLAGDSAATVTRHAAVRLFVALAAAVTGASLVASASRMAMAPSLICLIALALAVYGLRATTQHSAWEGQ